MKRSARRPRGAPNRSFHRGTEAQRARRRLQRDGWPRLQMGLIVLLTGGAGFLASQLLHSWGLHALVLRYPLAVLLAYLVFLGLMWLWVHWRWDEAAESLVPDIGSGGGRGGSSPNGSAGPSWSAAGGRSGGGGASGSWDGSSAAVPYKSVTDSIALPDLVEDDSSLPLLAVVGFLAVLVAVLAASVWVVWSAPVLMAELLVDAAIAGGLYRRMQGMQVQGWWRLCLAHTFWPLMGLLVFFTALGSLAQYLSPEATHLMEVFELRGGAR